MTDLRIYAACLASYNNGALHGRWIEVSDDADAVRDEIAAMLRESKFPNVTVNCPDCDDCPEEKKECKTCAGFGVVDSAEEYAVHDYDDSTGITKGMGEHPDIDRICGLIGAYDELCREYSDDVAPYLMAWAVDRGSDPSDVVSNVQDAYAGQFDDAEDQAVDYVEACCLEIPETLQGYIDYRAIARDSALGGDIDYIALHDGRHLQSYEDMRGVPCIALYAN